MKQLIILLIGSLIIPAFSKTAVSNTDTIPYYFLEASQKFSVDVNLLYAFCTVESNCRAKAINKDDAIASKRLEGVVEHSHGLFQIKLATARGLGFKGKIRDLMNPAVNTYYAAKLIRELSDRYGTMNRVISAYNAGHPIRSNIKYVNKVLRYYNKYKTNSASLLACQ